MGRWMEKQYVIYILSDRKEWNLSICGSIDGPRAYYNMWNKLYKCYMISLMSEYEKQNKNEQT